jgi:hypothetical protein
LEDEMSRPRKEIEIDEATIMSVEDLSHSIAEYYADYDNSDLPSRNENLKRPSWIFDALIGGVDGIKVFKELGFDGRYRISTYKGKQYVIIKGYPGRRLNLTGPRYSANNPKVVSFGLGPVAARQAFKKGTVINVIVLSSLDIVDYMLSDEQNIADLTSNIFFSINSAVISNYLAAIGGAALVAATGYVAVGVFAGIAISISVSKVLDYLDESLGVVSELSMLIESAITLLDDHLLSQDEVYTNEELNYVLQNRALNEEDVAQSIEDYYDSIVPTIDDYRDVGYPDFDDGGYDNDGGFDGHDYHDGGYGDHDGGSYGSYFGRDGYDCSCDFEVEHFDPADEGSRWYDPDGISSGPAVFILRPVHVKVCKNSKCSL